MRTGRPPDARLIVGVAGPEPHHLALLARPMPTIDETSVLVRVRAAGVNRADIAQVRRALTSGPTAAEDVPGLGREFAGEIAAVGRAVPDWRPGDRVMGMFDGAFADHVEVDHRLLIPLPSRWEWTDGAAMTVPLMTAHDALVTNAGLEPGERLLVTAASSTVGAIATAMGGHLGAGHVVAVARNGRHTGDLTALGADTVLVIDRRATVEQTSAWFASASPDVVIDLAGGPLFRQIVEALAVRGRIVTVGRLAGTEASIDLGAFARRRGTVFGVSFTSRTITERAEVARKMWADLGVVLESDRFPRLRTRTFRADRAEAALTYAESRPKIEKVVLEFD